MKFMIFKRKMIAWPISATSKLGHRVSALPTSEIKA
jgi:hypothetical protein